VILRATLLIGAGLGLGFSSLSVAATAGGPDAEPGVGHQPWDRCTAAPMSTQMTKAATRSVITAGAG
jgi:hypothetical protein